MGRPPRRQFLITTGTLLAASLAAAHPSAAVHRIGYLAGGGTTQSQVLLGAFRERLRDLGWVEGKNIVIDYRFARGKFDQLPALAAELVRQKVTVIAAGPTPAAVAAKNATSTIPIVMWGVADPSLVGLIANLAPPGLAIPRRREPTLEPRHCAIETPISIGIDASSLVAYGKASLGTKSL